MMRLWKIILLVIVLSLISSAASAAPVAKVKAFPNGEGLEEFLNSIDGSRIIRVEKSGESGDTAILAVPMAEGYRIAVYGAGLNENFEVVPHYDEKICEVKEGYWILFRCVVPEGMPTTVVVVKDMEGKEHFWSPAFSGIDGSLITNGEFVPFTDSAKDNIKSNLVKLIITGQDVNLLANPDSGSSVIRKTSPPEFFIGEEATLIDSSGDEWREIVYSVNEVNDCLHEVEFYVSAKLAASEKLDEQTNQKISGYEAAKLAFGALTKWEDVIGPSERKIGTIAWTDVKVHTEPNPGSQVVGIIPKSPEDMDADNPDVYISGWRLYEGQDPEGRIGQFDVWWRVESPIAGWVEGKSLGVMNSGLLSGY